MLIQAVLFVSVCTSYAYADGWRFNKPHLILEGSGLMQIDDALLLRQHSPEKDKTWAAVVPEYPWEAGILFYTSLLELPPDFKSGAGSDVRYHLYYPCIDEPLLPGDVYSCIAVSTDGETFTKPMLDLFPYSYPNGTTVPTNRFFQTNRNHGPTYPHAVQGSVIITRRSGDASNTSAPLAVMVYEEQAKDRHLLAAVSADGIHFRNSTGPGAPYIQGLPSYFADTDAAVLELGPDVRPLNSSRDGSGGGCFVAYGRLDVFPGGTCPVAPERTFRRAQAAYAVAPNGSCSSTVALGPYHDARQTLDIQRGKDPAQCLDVYNTAPQLVPGAVLAMPSMYRHIAGSNNGVMDARLLVSRDGVTFTPISRRPFLPRGIGYRDESSGWFNATGSERDAGFVFVTVGGLMDDRSVAPAVPSYPGAQPLSPYMWLLYWGSQTTHASGGAHLAGTFPGAFAGILRARIRREGFVSLGNSREGAVGAARSVLLQLPASEEACPEQGAQEFGLRLNVEAPNGGNVTVALLDGQGNEYPGFGHGDALPVQGNYLRAEVGWAHGSNFTALHGSAMQMDIRVADADVYSWELVCQ